MDKLDSETQKELSKGREIKELLESPGWGHVRSILSDKILDLQSVMNITQGDPQGVVTEILSRQIAVKILFDTLKEVEGMREQYDTNSKIDTEEFIKRY